jgi:hypothetical protein
LAATGLDYTFAGDYDYSVFKALREDASGIATPETYDYDYGQLQAIPQSAVTTGRTSTELDNDVGRCAVTDAVVLASRQCLITMPHCTGWRRHWLQSP